MLFREGGWKGKCYIRLFHYVSWDLLTTEGEALDAVKVLCKQAGSLSHFSFCDIVFNLGGQEWKQRAIRNDLHS